MSESIFWCPPGFFIVSDNYDTEYAGGFTTFFSGTVYDDDDGVELSPIGPFPESYLPSELTFMGYARQQ